MVLARALVLAHRICKRKTRSFGGVLNLDLQRLLILNDRLAEKALMQTVCSRGLAGSLICNFRVPAFVSQSCGRLIRRDFIPSRDQIFVKLGTSTHCRKNAFLVQSIHVRKDDFYCLTRYLSL